MLCLCLLWRRRYNRHKDGNVCDLLPERDRPQILVRIRGAWALSDRHLARERLELLASELDRTWPDAAASLREGIEDTLTLMRLGIGGQLSKTLCSTNPCESMIEIVRYTQRNVKRAGRTVTLASAGPLPACSSPSSNSGGSSATATSPSS
jgi:putative transposase